MRKLTDITLEEAIEVLKLGEGYRDSYDYKLRVCGGDRMNKKVWIRIYYEYDGEEHVALNVSHDSNAISLCNGNQYYRTIYRIVKYLESRGFDLEDANKNY